MVVGFLLLQLDEGGGKFVVGNYSGQRIENNKISSCFISLYLVWEKLAS